LLKKKGALMKKAFLITILSFGLTALANTETSSTMSTTVGFSPLGILLQSTALPIGIEAEVSISDRITVGPVAKLWDFSYTMEDGSDAGLSTKGIGYGLQGRFYSNGVTQSGFYAMGALISVDVEAATPTDSLRRQMTATNYEAGYRWVSDGLSMHLGLGQLQANGDGEFELDAGSTNPNIFPTSIDTMISGPTLNFVMGFIL
jgi:hypothetical protein